MDNTVELPLNIHLFPCSQAKSMESQGTANVAKHGFYNTHPSAVMESALGRIDLAFHVINVRLLFSFDPMQKYRCLAGFGFIGVARTFRAKMTGQAIPFCALGWFVFSGFGKA